MVDRGSGKSMALIKNKKGVVFILIVIALLSLFLISYTIYNTFQERKSTQKRIETMSNFLVSLEEDLPRQLFITSFRSIFIMEKEIIENNTYIDDVNLRLNELFFNGTIFGETDPNITILMQGATFSDMIQNINEKAAKINVNVTLSTPSLNITQEDPWNVKVIMTTNISLSDSTGLASWNKTEVIFTLIPVTSFEDPVYPLESNNPGVSNKINKTPHTSFDSASLLDHATNQYYLNSSEAPSFLDRLQGDLSSQNPHGIESLVYVPGLPAQNQHSKSIVDHIYWSGSLPSDCQISGQPSWFILDDSSPDHLNTYNAVCA